MLHISKTVPRKNLKILRGNTLLKKDPYFPQCTEPLNNSLIKADIHRLSFDYEDANIGKGA